MRELAQDNEIYVRSLLEPIKGLESLEVKKLPGSKLYSAEISLDNRSSETAPELIRYFNTRLRGTYGDLAVRNIVFEGFEADGSLGSIQHAPQRLHRDGMPRSIVVLYKESLKPGRINRVAPTNRIDSEVFMEGYADFIKNWASTEIKTEFKSPSLKRLREISNAYFNGGEGLSFAEVRHLQDFDGMEAGSAELVSNRHGTAGEKTDAARFCYMIGDNYLPNPQLANRIEERLELSSLTRQMHKAISKYIAPFHWNDNRGTMLIIDNVKLMHCIGEVDESSLSQLSMGSQTEEPVKRLRQEVQDRFLNEF